MTKKDESKDKSKRRSQRYSLLKQALEPRILFDASLAAPPHDLGIPSDTPASETAHSNDPTHPVDQTVVKQADAKAAVDATASLTDSTQSTGGFN